MREKGEVGGGGVGTGVPLGARVAQVTGRGKRHDILSLSWKRARFFVCVCVHHRLVVCHCAAVGLLRFLPFWCLHCCPLI